MYVILHFYTILYFFLFACFRFNKINLSNFVINQGSDTDNEGILSCLQNYVLWNENLCNVTQTNRTHTVCSCDQSGDLLLYMLTIPNTVRDPKQYQNISENIMVRNYTKLRMNKTKLIIKRTKYFYIF